MRAAPVTHAALAIHLPSLDAGAGVFRDVAADVGLRVVHDNGGRGDYYLPEIMGSGGALFDYDNDGDLDVFLVQGQTFDARGPRVTGGSRLFRNDLIGPIGGADSGAGRTAGGGANGDTRVGASGGMRGGMDARLRFTDVTDRSGITLDAPGMGAAVADVDNDADLDLLVTAFGRNVLYRNNGDGTFTDVTREAGLDDPRWNTSAAFLDYDRDGDLDLFVASYVDFTVAGNKICADPVGARDYCSPKAYRPIASRLYRNEWSRADAAAIRFSDVSEAAGISRAYGAGLGVAVGDYNGDGWPDLFVANDATPNQLWINTQRGTFDDRGLISGTAFNAEGNPEGSMGIASGDYDRDGDEDLFVTNLIGETHALYVNDGRGNFEDLRTRAGLRTATAPYTGFGTGWIDYDLDGRLDLFLTNGAVNIVESLRGQPFPFHQIDQLFRQMETGAFRETTKEGGEALAQPHVGRGAAFGDVDNDGDVDILVTNNNGPVRLLLNQRQTLSRVHWLTIRLDQGDADPPRGAETGGTETEGGTTAAAAARRGNAARHGNRWAYGARIGVERRGEPTLWRRVGTDGSYLSASDPRIHVGLGTTARVDGLIVEWPDGTHERWPGMDADRAITLTRGTGTPTPAR